MPSVPVGLATAPDPSTLPTSGLYSRDQEAPKTKSCWLLSWSQGVDAHEPISLVTAKTQDPTILDMAV